MWEVKDFFLFRHWKRGNTCLDAGTLLMPGLLLLLRNGVSLCRHVCL